MKPVVWMGAVGLLSWLAATLVVGPSVNPEALFGMLGPLVSTCATAVLTNRAFRIAPERLTALMIGALLVKVVCFGAYVVVMLRVLGLRPVLFIVSFTVYFVALYGMEALFLRRLLQEGAR